MNGSLKVFVKSTDAMGRGVFAAAPAAAGELLWIDHIVILPDSDRPHIRQTVIADYYFDIEGVAFICVGIGSLVNHSDTPNADYRLNVTDATLTFTALRAITAGEQITIDYCCDSYPWKAPRVNAASPAAPNSIS